MARAKGYPVTTVHLVACGKLKRSTACAAQDLYVGDLFQKARAYAERRGSWAILSAKHGLVLPTARLDPYNQTLIGASPAVRTEWAALVARQLREDFPNLTEVVFLAGRDYRYPLEALLSAAGIACSAPMQGLGLGQQKQWLMRNPWRRGMRAHYDFSKGRRNKYARLLRNPTPKLKKIRAVADRWVKQYGWQVALNKASRMERGVDFRHGRLLRRVLYRIRDEEAVKPSSQQSSKVISKKRVRVTSRMYQELLDEYGTSDALYVRGFILENGECLNLGRYDDHRIINSVYADTQAAEDRFGSRYGAMANLCRHFNMIRWMPEQGYAEVFTDPTGDQLRTLNDLDEAGKLRMVEVNGSWDVGSYQGAEVSRTNPPLGNTGWEFKQNAARKLLLLALRQEGANVEVADEAIDQAFTFAKQQWERANNRVLSAREYAPMRLAATLQLARMVASGELRK